LTLQDQAYTSAGKCHCLSFREIKQNIASEFFGRRSLTDPSESIRQTEPGRFGHIEPYWGLFDGVADDGAIRRVQVNDRRNQRVLVERGNAFEAELHACLGIAPGLNAVNADPHQQQMGRNPVRGGDHGPP
jgi:hypothetical protein